MSPSRRQLELLALHSSGLTYDEIAAEKYVSRSLVHHELRVVKAALGARNLYHAQVLALASGRLELDGREGCLFVPERELLAA